MSVIRKSIFVSSFILPLVLLSATLSSAQHMGGPQRESAKGEPTRMERKRQKGGHQGKKGREEMMLEVMKEIGVTAEQEERLRTLHENMSVRHKEIRKEMKGKRQSVRMELDKPESDLKKLDQLVEEMTLLEKELIEQRIDGVLDMKKVLTPEQFELLTHKLEIKEEVQKEMRKMMRQKHHKKSDEFEK